MSKINSFYGFLKDLEPNEDGSFNYKLKNRILAKYHKCPDLQIITRRPLSVVSSNKKEAA